MLHGIQSRTWVKSAIAACAIAWLMAPSPASGSTITYFVNDFDAFPDSIALPQFNPSYGTLTGAIITMSGQLVANLKYENPTQNQFDVTTSWASWLSVVDPFGAQLYSSQSQTSTDTVTAYDGARDYLGPSGNTFTWVDTPSITNTYALPAQLAFVTGTGSLFFPADAYAESGITFPGGNLWQVYDVVTSTSVSVTYDYDPASPIPEPATIALVGAALAGAGLRRRRW